MAPEPTIRGVQQAQAAALRALAAIHQDGALGDAVRYVTARAHRYLTTITPVDTGTWRASHRPEVNGLRGRIFMDPSAQNPKGGGYAAEYGAELEQRRGGRYAVYRKTVEEAGGQILEEAGRIIWNAL